MAQWIVAVIFAALGGLMIGGNAHFIWLGLRGQRAPSLFPLLGGLFGAIAIGIAPVPVLDGWWWIPLVVDPGGALFLGFCAVYFARESRRRPQDPA